MKLYRLCQHCAERCGKRGLTGQGVKIPEKYTCDGCLQDTAFVVRVPADPSLRLLIEVALALELDAREQKEDDAESE